MRRSGDAVILKDAPPPPDAWPAGCMAGLPAVLSGSGQDGESSALVTLHPVSIHCDGFVLLIILSRFA